MTTQTADRRAVTLPRVLASEWTKTAGLASTLWVPITTVLVAVAIPLGLTMFARPGDGTTAAGLVVSGVILVVLGALVFRGEMPRIAASVREPGPMLIEAMLC